MCPSWETTVTVTYTSLEAYRRAVINGTVSTQRDRIFKWLCLYSTPNKGFTRNEIAEYTHVRLSGVCGRINQLIADGYCEEVGEREDKFTGVNSKVVIAKLPHVKPQMKFEL